MAARNARQSTALVELAIKRLDAHAPHQGGDVPAADREALAKQVAQHPAASERILQMQLVDPPHYRQISGGTGGAGNRRSPG